MKAAVKVKSNNKIFWKRKVLKDQSYTFEGKKNPRNHTDSMAPIKQ